MSATPARAPEAAFPVPLGRRWTAADQVHRALETMVIDGTLKPGDRLTELDLAARLQVSRTPLRQALEKLVGKGWMRRAANGAIHVVDVSEQEIEALYAVRSSLEELVLREAAARITRVEIEALERALAQQQRAARASDAQSVSRHGEEFHRCLWRLSGNAVGMQFLEEVLQRTTRYRRLSFAKPERFRKGLEQHRTLLAALSSGDIDRACSVLRKHVDESRRYVLQAFRDWRKKDVATSRSPARASSARARP
jgi:DNA-binding GntR family transcriptional regulator